MCDTIKKFFFSPRIVGVVFFPLFLFCFMLGSRPLSAPDEGRYTEIPREMVQTGDYITPRLNGVKYFEKPPLMYWAAALSIKVAGGVHTWFLRFWPAFLGLVTVWATYGMGRFLGVGPHRGLWGAVMLASCVLFYAHTRLLILDMAVSTFITLGLYSFFMASQEALSRQKRFYALMGFFIALALAVLSKGLIGIILPGAIILAWSIAIRSWSPLKRAFHPVGLLLFLAIALPWHILAARANPEFFDFYVIHEHVTRYLEKVHNRYQPFWFFVPITLLGTFPWTTYVFTALFSICKHKTYRQTYAFFLLWILIIFVFFSASSSKLIPYILPIFPPMMLLTGGAIERRIIPQKWAAYGAGVLSLMLACALPFVAYHHGFLAVNAPLFFWVMGVVGVLAWLAYAALKDTRMLFFGRYLPGGALFLMLLNGAWPYLDVRSVKSLAHVIKQDPRFPREVIAFGRYYQDLPPYLNQTIKVVGWEGELAFGMKQEDTSAWMMSFDAFFRWYDAHKPSYIVTRKDFLPQLEAGTGHTFKIVAQKNDDILLVP